ncbi:hypothetical protein PPE03_24000 [Pseudoalteromonas peptidolytica]|nr:hypothetical protein PPE03_24000 [Pseudoalteromonas peptidolytica]
MPADAFDSIAINSKLNLSTPKNSPTLSTFYIDVLGKGIKNTAGIATTKKRKPENKIGGSSARPNLMTEKLSPQIITTIKANEMLFTFTRVKLRLIVLITASGIGLLM